MNLPDGNNALDQVPDAVLESDARGFPVIWLLPLVAILVGGWLLYKTMAEKGPEVVIQFRTAAGIEEGKTKIKYRDVVVGQVRTVRFADDLSQVLVTAEMVPGMESHLTESTDFWVVRPRIGAAGVSGLETLVSGTYVAMDPGEGGASQRRFTGLSKPPIITSDQKGTRFYLEAEKLGSLTVGSPIYFREIIVGEVVEYQLADDHQQVDIGIFIHAPHDQFVRGNTRFWNVGGVDISVDSTGVQLEMGSLATLLTGGVAFETPLSLAYTDPSSEDSRFHLFGTYTESQERTITKRYPYVLNFSDTVRGLSVGAPVEFRGIRVGTVTDIAARIDMDTHEIVIPVLIEMEPERVFNQEDLKGMSDDDLGHQNRLSVERLVARGMRARLQTGNLITGQLYVELDIFPDATSAQVNYDGFYPQLPTVPRPLSGMTASINRILDRLEEAPVEEMLDHLDELVVSASKLLQTLDKETPALGGELRATTQEARDMLKTATETLHSLQDVTSRDGEMGNTLYNTLDEMRAAARSIRIMSEYLERHPEALLQGKGGPP